MNQPDTNPAEEPAAKELPSQAEMPFAVIQGEPLALLPEDLYIPPDALEVFMEHLKGH